MDQEDTDKMDFAANLVHELLYVSSQLKLVLGHSTSFKTNSIITVQLLDTDFVSHPFRSYAKGRLPLSICAKIPMLKLCFIRQRNNLRRMIRCNCINLRWS